MPDSNGGKLAVLIAGFGCLSTTFVAGCLLVRKRLLPPDGSISQMPTPALGSGMRPLNQVLGLAPLDDLVFGGWSIFPERMSAIAELIGTVSPEHLDAIRGELHAVQPMEAYYDPASPACPIDGSYVKDEANKAAYATALGEDIRRFQEENGCSRAVMLWCGSTERLTDPSPVFDTIERFAEGLHANDPAITSSQVYAWAAVQSGVPFASASLNRCVGFPALEQLAARTVTPLAGEVFRPASRILRDRFSNQPANDGAPPPFWWQGRDEELLEWKPGPGMYADLLAEGRAKMPLLKSRRTAPTILDVALLLDFGRRERLAGLQHWLDPFFLRPVPQPNLQGGGAAALIRALTSFMK